MLLTGRMGCGVADRIAKVKQENDPEAQLLKRTELTSI